PAAQGVPQLLVGLDALRLVAARPQRLEHLLPAGPAHLVLGAAPAADHRDPQRRHRGTAWGSPRTTISRSRSTPNCSSTASWASSARASTSAALAWERLTMKLACLSLICAPPMRRPRNPAAST